MDVDEFWYLIEASRRRGDRCKEQTEALVDLLEQRSPDEIVSFQRHFSDRRRESYRWDLWAVAYIINFGCSDDGFDYFRGWLIAQGRQYFEAALVSAERAANRASPGGSYWCEDILYAADRAYESRTGNELPPEAFGEPRIAEGPQGEKWAEEELERLYPELCQRFVL